VNPVDELARQPEVVALAAARSHTDAAALSALSALDLSPKWVTILDSYGYTIRSGEEWRLEPDLRRRALAHAPKNSPAQWRHAHEYYYSLAVRGETANVASYLRIGAGRAYHGTEISTALGLDEYRAVAHIDSLAIGLDAVRMADEQSLRGLLDSSSTQLTFLRGMTLYRQGRMYDAIPVLRLVADTSEISRETAVAQHLVARWDCRRGSVALKNESKRFFNTSLKTAKALPDLKHQAHVEHSMAICLLRQSQSNYDRSIKLLRNSLALTKEVGDTWGEAKVLHTLGKYLLEQPRHRREALQHLRISRDIGSRLGYKRHVAWVDETMAQARTLPRAKNK
jgi:hypothetical protein